MNYKEKIEQIKKEFEFRFVKTPATSKSKPYQPLEDEFTQENVWDFFLPYLQDEEAVLMEFVNALLKVDWRERYVDSGDIWLQDGHSEDTVTDMTPKQFKKFIDQYLTEKRGE